METVLAFKKWNSSTWIASSSWGFAVSLVPQDEGKGDDDFQTGWADCFGGEDSLFNLSKFTLHDHIFCSGFYDNARRARRAPSRGVIVA